MCGFSRDARRAAAARRRRRLRAYGRYWPTPKVAPAQAVAHLEQLRTAHGLSLEALAELCELSTKTICTLLYPGAVGAQQWITPQTHKAVLGCEFDLDRLAPTRMISGYGTRRRLQGLAVQGWSWAGLATRRGVTVQAVARLASADTVEVGVAREIRGIYRDLAQRPGPSPRVAARAARAGWAGPESWDDASIEDPAVTPRLPAGNDLVDDVAIERFLGGDQVTLTGPERGVALARALHGGLNTGVVAHLFGVSDRTVLRWKAAAAAGVEAA